MPEAYCSDDDVKNSCSDPMQKDTRLPAAIAYWKPLAQEIIDDLLSPIYETPLTFVPEKVRFATAIMTTSLLLANPLSNHNAKETKEEKIITLSQLRESQAIKLIKNLINQKAFDSRLTKRKPENSKSHLVKIGRISQIRDIGRRDYI